MSFLDIRDARVVYPNGHEALQSINIQAEAGQIIAIIGRSGAGKSTLLRCINGMQKMTSGSVTLDGDVISTMTREQLIAVRRRIGFIWQEYNLVERLPVMLNVLSGRLGYNRGIKSLLGYFERSHREIALRNLERVNLLEKAAQRSDRLSGGEKQRVSIARAMSQEPKILLADEPVASLDPELARLVLSDLARIAREDRVLTLINIHHVELAREFADRVIGIARGLVVYDGLPNDLGDDMLDRIYRARHQGPESRKESYGERIATTTT
jgi:phosphonate transport system ATP-binding protein